MASRKAAVAFFGSRGQAHAPAKPPSWKAMEASRSAYGASKNAEFLRGPAKANALRAAGAEHRAASALHTPGSLEAVSHARQARVALTAGRKLGATKAGGSTRKSGWAAWRAKQQGGGKTRDLVRGTGQHTERVIWRAKRKAPT